MSVNCRRSRQNALDHFNKGVFDVMIAVDGPGVGHVRKAYALCGLSEARLFTMIRACANALNTT